MAYIVTVISNLILLFQCLIKKKEFSKLTSSIPMFMKN